MRTFLVLISLGTGASAQHSRHQTIANDILDLESAVVDVPPQMIDLLDSILDQAGALQLSKTAGTAAEAHDVLAQIDQLLARRGFAVPANGQVTLLRDVLSATQVSKSAATRLANAPNAQRAGQLIAGEGYHFFSSDTGAFLYLAIGELAGLPLVVMERPAIDAVDAFQLSHYFIRYRLAGGGSYDWDVVTGAEQQGSDHAFALNRTMVLGHATWSRGNIWLRFGSYQKAAADFRAAVALFPRKAGIANSLAWLLATCPNPQVRDGSAAIGYAQTACALAPSCPNFRETLAAAFAASGRFGEAEAVERQVLEHMRSSNRKSEYRARADLYHAHERYLTARPETQLARDYCDQLSEAGDGSLLCSTH